MNLVSESSVFGYRRMILSMMSSKLASAVSGLNLVRIERSQSNKS